MINFYLKIDVTIEEFLTFNMLFFKLEKWKKLWTVRVVPGNVNGLLKS